MISEVPIDITTATADGEISLDVELDGLTYTLRFSFSDASQLWYMSVYLQTNTTVTPIAQGLPVVTRAPLLAGIQVADRPAGELIVTGSIDAGRSDLGSLCKLLYYDASEIEAL